MIITIIIMYIYIILCIYIYIHIITCDPSPYSLSLAISDPHLWDPPNFHAATGHEKETHNTQGLHQKEKNMAEMAEIPIQCLSNFESSL